MTEPEQKAEPPTQAPPPASPPSGLPEVCPPCPPGEEKAVFPTHFARLFFGVITLLVLYYSYEIVKPYLIDIFLALVLFFTAKPLHRVLTRILFGQRALASALP